MGTKKSLNHGQNNSFIKMWESMTATVCGFYVFLILFIFPMYYQDYYFDILVAKYRFYYVSTLSLIIITAIIFFAFLITDFYKYKGIHTKQFIKNFKTSKITASEWALFIFLIIVTISTIQSDYRYEAFWGNEGRFSGMFLMLLYGISFLIISRFLRFRQWYIDAFLLSSMFVCGLGIAHYFKLDPLKFKANIELSQYYMFSSTIGNVNTYTSYVSLVVGAAAALFAIEKNITRQICYFAAMCIGLFALITGMSDNAYLALGVLIVTLPLYLFSSVKKLKKYFLIITVIFTEFQFIDILNQKFPDHITPMNGLFDIIAAYDKLPFIVCACGLVCIALYAADYVLNKEKDKEINLWLRILWLCGILLAVCIADYLLYDVNIAGNIEKYGPLSRYLIIDDEWGTHRGYIWRIGMENFLNFPLIHKLFGSGLDTFGILTSLNNYEEMIARYNEIFDSAHNEYLQYFITIGILGLISYLAFLFFSCLRIMKNSKKSPVTAAVFFAVICYSGQAFVNINLPIVTPVMWTLLMVGLAGCNSRRA